MNLKIFLQIIKSRAGFIAFVILAVFITMAAITYLQPKRYTASTSLVLTLQDTGPFEQLGVPNQLATSYMATQVDIVKSHKVAQKVVDGLGIVDDPNRLSSFLAVHDGRETESPEGSARDWLADRLLESLTVRPARESRVLRLEYESADPELSAEIVDSFAQSYIDTTLELSMEPARRNAAWFDEQLKTLQEQLRQQQNELTNYQQTHGIVAIDEQVDTETRRLEEISSNLTQAQAHTFDVRSRQLGAQHPEVIRAIAQERALQRSLDVQKAKVLEVKQQRDQLQMLLRNVENTRSTYDAAIQRYYQSSLESQFNQTNIAVLNKAVVPALPSSPRVLLNLALALLLGTVFALGLVIVGEILQRRVRVQSDLSDVLNVPVLANI